jgi:hypothetical protein
LNWYTYAGNNPIVRTDPSGYLWISETYESIANYFGGRGFKTNEQLRLEVEAEKNREITANYGINKKAQHYLNYMGFDTGGVDGIIGVRSSVAIILFQYSQGLSVTGVVDDATLEKIVQCAGSGLSYSDIMESDAIKNWVPGTPTVERKYPSGFLKDVPMVRIPTFNFKDSYVERETGIAWAMMVNYAMEYNKTAEIKLNINRFASKGPDSGYRDFDKQQYFWDLYIQGKGNLAAEPGKSNHGWGLAIDMDLRDPGSLGGGKGYATTEEVRWLEANAGRFGFSGLISGSNHKGNIYKETWHWDYMKK